MFDIVLVLFGVIVIAGAILVFGGNDDDDHTHRPHTGNMGDLWQNKNQIFVGVIFP